jgi:CheY-like chemotaxis protein
MSRLDKSEYSATQTNGRPFEILLVEDLADDSDLCLRMFRKMQLDMDVEFNTHAVSDSAQAAIQITEQKFDAIFLDIGMPPPDGIELAKRIRSSAVNRTTPIVIITGAEDRGLMARAFQAGANFFLFKPINRTQLVRLMHMSLVPMDRERRKLRRIEVKCKVSIESERSRFDGETVDLSMEGMLVRAACPLPVGSVVRVSLMLPQTASPICSTARLVRTVGNELVGLQLESIGKAESDRLGEFLVTLITALPIK